MTAVVVGLLAGASALTATCSLWEALQRSASRGTLPVAATLPGALKTRLRAARRALPRDRPRPPVSGIDVNATDGSRDPQGAPVLWLRRGLPTSSDT